MPSRPFPVLSPVVIGSLLMVAELASAATYHVCPSGDDARSGLSPAEAWQTVARANRQDFAPGDHLLFAAGAEFFGPLRFDRRDGGETTRPVKVATFGEAARGPAVIRAGIGRGIDVHNMSGLRVENLKVVGDGADINRQSGILLLSTCPNGSEGVTIDRVEVTGFGKHGISVGAWNSTAGYRDVRITRCETHHNLRTGVFTWGPWGAGIYAHRQIYIADTRAFKMKGGSGLTFSSVDGGIIERCIAFENGENHSGGAGIWAWDATNILFQYNESYANRTIGADGDGFDFDGGVTNSIMQYNYSHDNDAAGYLLAQYRHAPQPMENIVIRFNISENDCRKKPYGAIHIWNGCGDDRIRNIHIYQNTVFMTPPPSEKKGPLARGLMAGMQALGLTPFPQTASAMAIISPTRDVTVSNNIFSTTGGVRLLSVIEGQRHLRLQNNAYWSAESPFSVEWMGAEYASFTEWLEAAQDQERQGAKILAIHADPRLRAPGTGGTLGNADFLSTLDGYRLEEDSPLGQRGLDLRKEYGIDVGDRGFFGEPVPGDTPPAVGASML